MMEYIQEKKPFKRICLGGTFDHLHEGHRNLLRTAEKLGCHLSIGLATEKLFNHKKHRDKIQCYDRRKKDLSEFLEKNLNLSKDSYNIIPLDVPLGPAVIDSQLEAQVCSAETYRGCININKVRIEKGLPPMTIVIIPITTNSSGKKLSSTDIRANLKQNEGENN